MSNKITTFSYSGIPIRTTTNNQVAWFVLKDVCDVLGISNSRNVYNRLDEDEKGIVLTDTIAGTIELQTVNEFGLYDTIIHSSSPHAKPFRRWIIHEVIPSIRKTGTFQMRQLAKEQLKLASLEESTAKANARVLSDTVKLVEEMRKAIKSNDQFRIASIMSICEARGIDLPEFDYGCGFDMGDEIPTPAIERHEDGTISMHMKKLIEINGATKSLEDWCKKIKLTREGLRHRIVAGWSIEDALTKKSNR